MRLQLSRLLHKLAGISSPSDRAGNDNPEWKFASRVMDKHHFTGGAQEWLRKNVYLKVDDLRSKAGGGYWMPQRREVRLHTAQEEAAVHELAHAWWHYRREAVKDDLIEAVVRLSAEKNPRYESLTRLAFGYVHGIPEQPWEGLLVGRNDWEMFAGIASGTMGDMSKLPPYVRHFYDGLFNMPPSD